MRVWERERERERQREKCRDIEGEREKRIIERIIENFPHILYIQILAEISAELCQTSYSYFLTQTVLFWIHTHTHILT